MLASDDNNDEDAESEDTRVMRYLNTTGDQCSDHEMWMNLQQRLSGSTVYRTLIVSGQRNVQCNFLISMQWIVAPTEPTVHRVCRMCFPATADQETHMMPLLRTAGNLNICFRGCNSTRIHEELLSDSTLTLVALRERRSAVHRKSKHDVKSKYGLEYASCRGGVFGFFEFTCTHRCLLTYRFIHTRNVSCLTEMLDPD